MYTIRFTDIALADIKGLPKNVKNALRKQLQGRLAKDPAGRSTPLNEALAGYRSFHMGGIRVVFRVFEEPGVIAVVGIGAGSPQSADNIYRKLERLALSGRLAERVLRSLRGFSEG